MQDILLLEMTLREGVLEVTLREEGVGGDFKGGGCER